MYEYKRQYYIYGCNGVRLKREEPQWNYSVEEEVVLQTQGHP